MGGKRKRTLSCVSGVSGGRFKLRRMSMRASALCERRKMSATDSGVMNVSTAAWYLQGLIDQPEKAE